MAIRRILLIKGGTQYGVLRDFIDELKYGFEEDGVPVDIFDASLGLNEEMNKAITNTEYDLVLSFNGMLLGCQETILKNQNTLFWSFLVDHPYYHHYRLLAKCNNHLVSCIDKNHVSYIKKYYPNIEHAYYMPHGGSIPTKEIISLEDKSYDVCIIGTYSNTQQYEDIIHNLPEPDKSIILSIVDKLKHGCTTTIEDLYELELKNRGITISNTLFTELLNSTSFIDSYIRAYNRTSILDKLTSSGIKVDVFGNGWENYNCKHPELLTLHGSIPYNEAIRVMQNSKIIINPLPLFRDGSHERVFTSMLCNAICMSDYNTYLSEEFTHGEDIIFFEMTDLDNMVDNINSVLSNDNLAKLIIQNGYKKAKELHLWKHRSTEILKIANEVIESQTLYNEHIKIETVTDYQFNNIINYTTCFSTKLLAKKLSATFNYLELEDTNYQQFVKSYLINQNLWMTDDAEGNIFFRDESKELKSNIERYINLYHNLHDDMSRKTLLGLLNYKLSYNHKTLQDIISNEIIFKNVPVLEPYWEIGKDTTLLELSPMLNQSKPKLKIDLSGDRKYLWLLPELILRANSSYKLYLRYYGEGLVPDKIMLFCE